LVEIYKEDYMRKYSILLLALVVAFAFACASQQQATDVAQEQTSQQPEVASGPGAMFVRASNATLAPASEELGVFQPSSAALSAEAKATLSSKVAQIVGKVVNEMPEGYVVQITGHSAKVASDCDTDAVSTNRAKAVYDSVVAGGVDAAKLTYKGVGNSQPREGFERNSNEQRRVTFQVVPK
jgi:outer membrane protein OmpA-like peptidoglycan-associated protein